MSRTNGEGNPITTTAVTPTTTPTVARMLAYADGAPAADTPFGFHREADALVLTVPPPPLARRMLFPAALLAGATLLAAAPLAMGMALRSDPSGWPIVLLLTAVGVSVWLLAFWHFRRQSRVARLPSTIRVEQGGDLRIALPSSTPATERLHWAAGQVRDLRVTSTGALPVIQEYLWLRVTPVSGTPAMVQVPWAMPCPGVGLLEEIQGTLREAVGLARTT